MTATQFTDDAYNKQVKGFEAGNGTLVGNWYEEVCQREGTGEGRTVPARHIRRSGLLKDFTRLPTDGTRKQDDTFERILGQRKLEAMSNSAAEVGKPDGKVHVTAMNRDPVQASLILPQVGAKELRDRVEYYDHAKEYVTAVQDAIDELGQRRELTSSSAAAYTIPVPTEPAETKAKSSGRRELLSGPPLADSVVYSKAGVDFDKMAHYTVQEAVTANTEFASNPESRAAVNLTPTINGFRRDFTFSVPCERFIKGPEKDSAEPPRDAPSIPLSQTPVMSVGNVSLVDVKKAISAQLAETYGSRMYVALRLALEEKALADKTVLISDATALFTADVPAFAVKCYLQQMATMAKDRVQITKVMNSLRPAVPNASLKLMAELYEALPVEVGMIDLTAWNSAVPAAKDAVCADLGVSSSMLSKDLLVEYLSDLSVAMSAPEFTELCAQLAPA
jgi:hypothetical protein